MSRIYRTDAAEESLKKARQNDAEADGGRHEGGRYAEEASSLWLITISPTVWAIHFVLAYGGTALYCARFAATETEAVPFLRLSIAGITALALLVIAFVGWRSWKQWDYLDDYDYDHARATGEDRHEFLGHAAFLLSVMSFIAVVYVAMPAIFMDTCR